jgi:hypothetical protein
MSFQWVWRGSRGSRGSSRGCEGVSWDPWDPLELAALEMYSGALRGSNSACVYEGALSFDTAICCRNRDYRYKKE